MGNLVWLTSPLSFAIIASAWLLFLLWVAFGVRGYVKAIDRSQPGDVRPDADALDELGKRRGRLVVAIFGLTLLVFVTSYSQLYTPRTTTDSGPTGSNVPEHRAAPATPTTAPSQDQHLADVKATAAAENDKMKQELLNAAATAGTGKK